MNARFTLKVLLALAIPCAGILATATPALADAPPAAAAHRGTPISRDARIQRFVLTPHGHVVGLVLDDGAVVHVRVRGPNTQVASLKIGDVINVQGYAAQTPTGVMISRAIVKRNGAIIADGSQRGERGQKRERGEGRRAEGKRTPLAQTTISAKVASVISTPRGKAHALLLDDGTTATARGIESLGLRVGDRVSVTGKGGTYAQGKAMRIETITLPNGEVRTLAQKGRRRGNHRNSAPV